jgi:hypothetical protein
LILPSRAIALRALVLLRMLLEVLRAGRLAMTMCKHSINVDEPATDNNKN